ncbi:MAG: rod shape-determining protein RodA [Clostridiaceae bacterium BRH_c20a]|nr:MAG: rod shape-determining protein RodA [Clostridiaceae bacterium BRH_c20a]
MGFYKKILNKVDYTLIAAVLLILVMSLFVLNSATAHLSSSYIMKQIMWIGFSIVVVLAILRLEYTALTRYSKYLYVINILLLVSVFFLGTEVKGAQSWIKTPLGSIQPSEFSKILLIITFAHYLVLKQGKLSKLQDLIPAFIFVAIPLLLILKQPDLGTALVIIAIMVGMLFVAGANRTILISVFGGGSLAGIGYILGHLKFGWWMPLKAYQLNRILVVFDPNIDPRGAGWNVWQSKIAIGSGGLLGKGLGGGTQSMGQFLPEQWTDFIFAVFAEELGFVGAGLLLIAFFILCFRGLKIAAASKDLYGSLIAAGIVSMYLFHIIENVGMALGVMPVTGIPLPFVSYGGSSMLTNMIGLGLLLNIYVRRQKIIF